MEARVLGAVLRVESTVQGRFSTALPQFVTAANVASRVPSGSWPLVPCSVYLPKPPALPSCLFDTRPPSLCTGHASFTLLQLIRTNLLISYLK